MTLVLLGLLFAALLNFPIPILAVQILAIDLLAQIMPLTFLTFDPPAEGTMTRPPRKPDEHMLDKSSGSEVMLLGMLIGGLAFMNFLFFMQREGVTLTVASVNTIPYLKATALTYAVIVYCQFVNTLQRRHEYTSLFNRDFFTNKILLGSILASMGLVFLAIYGPGISDFLAFGSIGLIDWLYVLFSAGIFLGVFEILKFFKRRRRQTLST